MARKDPPLGYDDRGVPIWAKNGKGIPICGAKKKSNAFCQNTMRCPNGRCRLHGGLTPRGEDNPNYKDGSRSIATLSRKALLDALASSAGQSGRKQPLVDRLILQLDKAIDKGDLSTIRWAFDQFAGTAKTTVKYEVDSAATLEAVAEAMLKLGIEQAQIDQVLDEAAKILTHDSPGSGSESQAPDEDISG